MPYLDQIIRSTRHKPPQTRRHRRRTTCHNGSRRRVRCPGYRITSQSMCCKDSCIPAIILKFQNRNLSIWWSAGKYGTQSVTGPTDHVDCLFSLLVSRHKILFPLWSEDSTAFHIEQEKERQKKHTASMMICMFCQFCPLSICLPPNDDLGIIRRTSQDVAKFRMSPRDTPYRSVMSIKPWNQSAQSCPFRRLCFSSFYLSFLYHPNISPNKGR